MTRPRRSIELQVELGDQDAFGGQLGGRQVGHLRGGDDHAAGVDREMAGQADQRLGLAEDELVERGGIALGQLGKGGVVRLEAVGRTVPALRQAFGQLADLGGRQAMGLGDLAQRRAAAEAVDRADHGHPVGAEAPVDEVDHLVAAAGAQVGVDIGRGAAGRVQEALEIQVQAHRVGGGDAQAVGGQRRGGRAARGDRDAALAGKADDLLHHQEEGLVAELLDHRQLVLQAGLDGGVGAVQAQGASLGFVAQGLDGRLTIGKLEAGEARHAQGKLQVAAERRSHGSPPGRRGKRQSGTSRSAGAAKWEAGGARSATSRVETGRLRRMAARVRCRTACSGAR